jgi:UDP-GlcNAc:undecaprenyl-phosphate GlcNAc-1-phosphate transferase
MKTLLAAFLLALGFSAALMPLFRKCFIRAGKLDHPHGRKAHLNAVPRSGGVAIMIAYLLAVGSLLLLEAGGAYVFENYSRFLLRLLPALTAVLLTGFLDDMIDLHPRFKLTGQIVAAATAYWAGVRLFDAPPGWEWISFPATAFWLVLCSNAFNLTDGTDGLAGTLTVLSSLGLIGVALSLNYYSLALVFAPLLGAVIPFLRENWPPARVFLGDAGSLTVGFLIGCGGAALARRFPGPEGLTAAVLIFTLPLLEVALSSARRWLRGRSIFQADSGHIHHQLKRQGHGDSAVLLSLGVLSSAATMIAVVQIWLPPAGRWILIGPFVCYLGFRVANLRYPEFYVLAEALLGGRIRSWFRHQILLRALEDDLNRTTDPQRWLLLLDSGASELGLLALNAKLGLQRLLHNQECDGNPNSYLVRIDLPHQNWVNFRVPVGLKRTENPAADFAALVLRFFSLQRLGQVLPTEALGQPETPAIPQLDRSA